MKSPKGEGARQAPIPKQLLTAATSTANRALLQACDPVPLVCGAWCAPPITRIDLANGIHHAKEVCGVCGRFLRRLPQPKTMERQKLTAFRLAKLAMRPDLTAWERNFVRSVSQRKKLSPKQAALVDRLARQYLEGKPS